MPAGSPALLRRLGVEWRIVTHPRAKTGWDSLNNSKLKVVHLAEGATTAPLRSNCISPLTRCKRIYAMPLPSSVSPLGLNWRNSCGTRIDQSVKHQRH
jgi:hypothetical protein